MLLVLKYSQHHFLVSVGGRFRKWKYKMHFYCHRTQELFALWHKYTQALFLQPFQMLVCWYRAQDLPSAGVCRKCGQINGNDMGIGALGFCFLAFLFGNRSTGQHNSLIQPAEKLYLFGTMCACIGNPKLPLMQQECLCGTAHAVQR